MWRAGPGVDQVAAEPPEGVGGAEGGLPSTQEVAREHRVQPPRAQEEEGYAHEKVARYCSHGGEVDLSR